MSYNPMIKEWEFYFKSKYGSENRTNIAKAFTRFIDSKDDKLAIPGKCMLGGEVFGREGFDDGDLIFTSSIQTVERVERGEHNGVPHDLMCATTASGSKYYFYSDEYNAYMFLMIGDIIHTGELNPSPYHYLEHDLRSPKLI